MARDAAKGTHHAQTCDDRWHRSRPALGGHPSHPGLVLLNVVSGGRGVWIACDDRHRPVSLEIGSIFLLLGAQVIAEYERLEEGELGATGELQTEVARKRV